MLEFTPSTNWEAPQIITLDIDITNSGVGDGSDAAGCEHT
jgi:hypothetical protein